MWFCFILVGRKGLVMDGCVVLIRLSMLCLICDIMVFGEVKWFMFIIGLLVICLMKVMNGFCVFFGVKCEGIELLY